jgi:hypothetical protein
MVWKPDRQRKDGSSTESEQEHHRGDGSSTEPEPERPQPEPDEAQSAALPASAGLEDPEIAADLPARPAFPHPQWMVGVVLIFAVLFIAGGLGNPLWLLVGSPFILVLVVYVWVKLASRLRAG